MQGAAADDDLPVPATSQFRVDLSYAIQNISPSLAALHVSRSRRLNPDTPSHDPFASTHCARCGTYLLDGTGHTRTVRKRRRVGAGESTARSAATISRSVRRVCSVCGHADDVPTDPGNAPGFPKARSANAPRAAANAPEPALPRPTQPIKAPLPGSNRPSAASSRAGSVAASLPSSAHQTSRTNTPVPTPPPPIQSPAPSSSPLSAPRAKARPKKKSGLQDMLTRNRERQAQEKKTGGSSGLASFLEGL